jgi:hypothetical protein
LLNSPGSGAVTATYDAVVLEWKAVAGATHYLLELDVNISYSSSEQKTYIVAGTSQLLPPLKPNQTYYWRVQPFSQLVGCAATRSRFFTTSAVSSVREIEGLSAMTLSPNPAGENQPVRLAVRSDRDFEANVFVFDYTGKKVWGNNAVFFASGDTFVDLPAGDFANGLYFVSLETAKGRSVRKLSVSK